MCVSNHPFHPSFSVHTNHKDSVSNHHFHCLVYIFFDAMSCPESSNVAQELEYFNSSFIHQLWTRAQPHYQRQVGNKKRISRISGAAIHLQAMKEAVLPPQATISPHLDYIVFLARASYMCTTYDVLKNWVWDTWSVELSVNHSKPALHLIHVITLYEMHSWQMWKIEQ